MSQSFPMHGVAWLLVALAALQAPAPALAQTKPAAGKPTAPKASAGSPAAAKPAPAKPAFDPAEEAARQKIMQSQEWRDMRSGVNQWLSAQVMYDAQQVKQLKAKLETRIASLSARQLPEFLGTMQEKLAVLNSDEARDAQAYLAETFAVASEAYAKRLRQRLPDISTMTAAQIDQQLRVFASKRSANRQAQQAFDASRQQQVQANQARLQAARREQEAALNRATSSAARSATSTNITPARDYYPDTGGGSSYFLPFYGFGGWGAGGVMLGPHRF